MSQQYRGSESLSGVAVLLVTVERIERFRPVEGAAAATSWNDCVRKISELHRQATTLLLDQTNNSSVDLNREMTRLAYDIENAVERRVLREEAIRKSTGIRRLFKRCSLKITRYLEYDFSIIKLKIQELGHYPCPGEEEVVGAAVEGETQIIKSEETRAEKSEKVEGSKVEGGVAVEGETREDDSKEIGAEDAGAAVEGETQEEESEETGVEESEKVEGSEVGAAVERETQEEESEEIGAEESEVEDVGAAVEGETQEVGAAAEGEKREVGPAAEGETREEVGAAAEGETREEVGAAAEGEKQEEELEEIGAEEIKEVEAEATAKEEIEGEAEAEAKEQERRTSSMYAVNHVMEIPRDER